MDPVAQVDHCQGCLGLFFFFFKGRTDGDWKLNTSRALPSWRYPSVCVHPLQDVCLKTPGNLAAAQEVRLGSQASFWSLTTPLPYSPFLECSPCLPPKVFAQVCPLPGMAGAPDWPFPAWFAPPPDFNAIITSPEGCPLVTP